MIPAPSASNNKQTDRMYLSFGGDSITEFLYHLLQKVEFPYKDLNLSRSYDWRVMEELKIKLCTLNEVCTHQVFLRFAAYTC